MRITPGAVSDFRRHFNRDASENAILALAQDARPPNDAEWRVISGSVRNWHFRERGTCFVVGAAAFAVRAGVVKTCWRWR